MCFSQAMNTLAQETNMLNMRVQTLATHIYTHKQTFKQTLHACEDNCYSQVLTSESKLYKALVINSKYATATIYIYATQGRWQSCSWYSKCCTSFFLKKKADDINICRQCFDSASCPARVHTISKRRSRTMYE